jgi:hypothetical protein
VIPPLGRRIALGVSSHRHRDAERAAHRR